MSEHTPAVGGERLWCTACGTVTRDMICDCNRWNYKPHRNPQFVNYADAMQETAHKQAQQIDVLAKALQNMLEFCQTQGDFKNGVTYNGIDEGEVWASGVFDEARAALASVKEPT